MDPELIAYLDRRFERVDRRLEQVDLRLDQVDRRLEQVDQRLDQVDQRLEQVDQRLVQVDRRLVQTDQRFEQVDQRFERVDSRFEHRDQQSRGLFVLLESLDSKIQLVAEGVLANGEAHRALRVELDRRFEELVTLNRLSYAELERRLAQLGL